MEDNEYYGAIREEKRKIVAVYEADKKGQEASLYNFNLKVGDKVTYNYLESKGLEVARIDTIEIEDIPRKRYYFYNEKIHPNEVYPYGSWIEDIGNEQDLLKPFHPLRTAIGGNPRINCVYQGEKALYKERIDVSCICSQAQSV